MRNRDLLDYRLSPQRTLPWHPGDTIDAVQAAKLLGCSNSTINRLINDGRLEAFKRRSGTSPWNIFRASVVRLVEEWYEESRIASSRQTSSPSAPSPKERD